MKRVTVMGTKSLREVFGLSTYLRLEVPGDTMIKRQMEEGKVQQAQSGLKASGERDRKGLENHVVRKTIYTLRQQPIVYNERKEVYFVMPG